MWSLIVFVAALAAAPAEVEIGTLDGSTMTGSLVELAVDHVTISAEQGKLTVPAAQLLFVSPKAVAATSADKPSVWIELVDGSRLTAKEFIAEKGIATLNGSDEKHFQIPTRAIARVRFTAPDDANSSWPADIGKQAAADLLAVRKMDAVDFLEGVIGDVHAETVDFQIDGETIPVKRTKIDGLIFYHKAADKQADPECIVDATGGWQLKAKAVSLADDGSLKIETVAGPELQQPLSAIGRLDFSLGKVIFLSDLEPDAVSWKPLVDFGDSAPALAQFYALRRDQAREHGPLRVGNKAYRKGLAIASRTLVVYRLPTGAKTFKAIVGIDDSVREAGHVVLKITADGKQLLSAPIAGRSDPVPVDLNVAGARKLEILVDYGEDLDTGDYLNLADARIVK